MKDWGICEVLTVILVAAKAFGFANITWLQAFSPLWIPWLVIAWLGFFAWNWVVCTVLTVILIVVAGG